MRIGISYKSRVLNYISENNESKEKLTNFAS